MSILNAKSSTTYPFLYNTPSTKSSFLNGPGLGVPDKNISPSFIYMN